MCKVLSSRLVEYGLIASVSLDIRYGEVLMYSTLNM
jgi:hypothetical protein